MKLTSALDTINQDWDSDIPKQEALTTLARYIYERKEQQLHLTYKDISSIVNNHSLEFIVSISGYLSGPRISILRQGLEFICGDDYWDIADEDLYSAITSGQVLHPETGLLIEDAQNFLFPYFSLGEEVE